MALIEDVYSWNNQRPRFRQMSCIEVVFVIIKCYIPSNSTSPLGKYCNFSESYFSVLHFKAKMVLAMNSCKNTSSYSAKLIIKPLANNVQCHGSQS